MGEKKSDRKTEKEKKDGLGDRERNIISYSQMYLEILGYMLKILCTDFIQVTTISIQTLKTFIILSIFA